MKIKTVIHNFLLKIGFIKPTFYINGPEVLPPPLAQNVEAELAMKNDKSSRDTLIVHNLRLVVYIARKFDAVNTNVEDLISIGTIGLIKAVNTFAPERNIKLATYASRCIENEILMFLRKNASGRHEISIDEPLNIDWDGNELLLSDVLGSEPDDVYRDLEDEDERSRLYRAVASLNKRERQFHLLIISEHPATAVDMFRVHHRIAEHIFQHLSSIPCRSTVKNIDD